MGKPIRTIDVSVSVGPNYNGLSRNLDRLRELQFDFFPPLSVVD